MPPRTAEHDDGDVVRWYTRARRFPQLIGKTATGGMIWGGPYTYTQVAVGVGVFVVGLQTTWLWGRFGLIGNTVLLAVVAYGLVVLVGRLPIGSRNPLSIGSGALRALGAPAHGRLAGAPLRLRRPHRVSSRLVVNDGGPTLDDVASLGAEAVPGDRRGRRHRSEEPAIVGDVVPTATQVPRLRPTPADTARSEQGQRSLTHVQRLLASGVGRRVSGSASARSESHESTAG